MFNTLAWAAVAGQIADCLTTWHGTEILKLGEANPLMRPMIGHGDLTLLYLLAFKLALTMATVCFYSWCNKRRAKSADTAMLVLAALGWVAPVYNIVLLASL